MSQNEGQVGRSSSESVAGTERAKVSVIEKSVTHLLVATKTLLETLTKWSRNNASETEVSDVYVRLGYEFNIACRAFKSVGVETADLGPVPDMLRAILEETLSGEPSQAHLDKYLPQIRDIIVNLLQGLKKKQQRLRQRNAKEREVVAQPVVASAPDVRQSSIATTQSPVTADNAGGRQSARYSDARRQGGETQDPQRVVARSSTVNGPTVPNRTSSGRAVQIDLANRNGTANSDEGPPLPVYNVQEVPTIAPPSYVQGDAIPVPGDALPPPDVSTQRSLAPPVTDFNAPIPRPQADALARLQRGGELERRASRRFSAFHIQKHLGTTSSGLPVMPSVQHSPVPNRGRDLHESMNAVRSRGSPVQGRGTPKNKYSFETSPNRQIERQEPISEEYGTLTRSESAVQMPADSSSERDRVARTQEQETVPSVDGTKPSLEEESKRPQWTTEAAQPPETPSKDPEKSPERNRSAQDSSSASAQTTRRYPRITPESTPAPSSESPVSAKELVLFLQYKTQIKKFVLADGYEELSIPRLQLAFIEKFAWNTHSNGVDLPEIYVQDPISGVRHELEDLNDVKNRSVLVLNVDAVDEVKRHMDDGMGGLKNLLQDVRTALSDQASAIQRFSDKQHESAKDLTRLANAPPPPSAQPARATSQPLPNGVVSRTAPAASSATHITVIQSLRRDLAIMRQTHTSWVTEMEAVVANVRTKAESVQTLASQPSFVSASDSTSGRSYVNSGRKTLASTSETIMSRVEDLQDTVEDLRKDVVTRGVRPLPRQLETITRELQSSTNELKKMQEYIKREKPIWTKIWKNELQVVCEDQNLLTYQEELVVDLEDDLQAAANTFELIEEATKQQNLVSQTPTSAGGPGLATPGQTGLRSTSRAIIRDTSADPMKAKDGVLGEVKALQPNHETRLEAIARAERMRQRELEERRDGAFKKELSGFVDEGRLKKSGGVEEAERVRKVKDERMRQAVWEGKGSRPEAPPPAENSSEADPAAYVTEGGKTGDTHITSPEATDDLSTLAGSFSFPGELAAPEKVDAAIAESATVPQPLDVPDGHRNGANFLDEPTSPEPEFVDARTWGG